MRVSERGMQTLMTNDEARMTRGVAEGRSSSLVRRLPSFRRSLCPWCLGGSPSVPFAATGTRMSNSAFCIRSLTMIEILVVISIITILAGMLIVSAIVLHNIGAERSTTGFMESIAHAQTQYLQTHRMYVPGELGVTTSDIYQLRRSTMVLWMGLEKSSGLLAGEEGSKSQGGVYTDPVTRNSSTPWYFYLDRWNTPMLYQCDPPCKTFKITSAGRDHIFGTGDDLVIER